MVIKEIGKNTEEEEAGKNAEEDNVAALRIQRWFCGIVYSF